MSVVFLIGGTGNQLFTYASCQPRDKFSTVFLSPLMRKLLNWTQHEQILTYQKPKFITQALALLVLCVDVVIAKSAGKSLLTTFDTRQIKTEPMLWEFCRLGYFQQSPEKRAITPITKQFKARKQRGQIVIHVRGGDLLAQEKTGQKAYGILGAAYYRTAILNAVTAIEKDGQSVEKLLVLTDDPSYAASLDLNAPRIPTPEIKTFALSTTISIAVGAHWFISSSSTLSYWMIRMRHGVNSVAPSPFQLRHDYPALENCIRLELDETQ